MRFRGYLSEAFVPLRFGSKLCQNCVKTMNSPLLCHNPSFRPRSARLPSGLTLPKPVRLATPSRSANSSTLRTLFLVRNRSAMVIVERPRQDPSATAPRGIKAQGLRVSPELFARLKQFVSQIWTGKSRLTMWLTRDLMIAMVRSYAKESPWHSRELALAPDLAACGQFL